MLEMSSDEIINIAVSIGSVFLGLGAGVWISDRKENKRKKEELEKIHFLLNADFTYINRVINIGINHHKERNDFIKSNGFAEITSNNAKLLEFLTEIHHKIGGFTYWSSLISSGSLIKLEPDELRVVTVTQNAIVQILSVTDEGHKRLVDNVTKLIVNKNDKTTEQKIQESQHEFELYMNGLTETFEHIKYQIQKVQNTIKWIDLKAEPIKLVEKNHVPTENT